MIKTIGFVGILIGLLFFLQPNLFKSNNTTEKEDINEAAFDTRNVETSEYAEGYSEEDFGDEFKSPLEGQFPVKQEEKPGGPWEDLLELKFNINFSEEVDDVVFEPKFTPKIKAYEGQIIEVEGFIIAHDIVSKAMSDVKNDGQSFMFSAYPMASCFFCGGAGAESVMEATPKKPINYTDKKIKLRGRLEFNTTDFLRLPYVLKDVVLVQP